MREGGGGVRGGDNEEIEKDGRKREKRKQMESIRDNYGNDYEQ